MDSLGRFLWFQIALKDLGPIRARELEIGGQISISAPTLLFLSQAKHTLHQVFVCRVYKRSLAQVALTLIALLSQQVAFEGFVSANLSGAGNFKSLFGTGVSLQLWHGLNFGMAKVRKMSKPKSRNSKNVVE